VKINGIIVGCALALACALGAALWGALPDARAEFAAGTALGFLLVAPSYFSLAWAMRRSDKTFYSVFAAGVLARLVVFAAAGYGAHRFTSLSFPAVLLSGIGAFFFLSLVEMYLLQREASGSWNFSKS